MLDTARTTLDERWKMALVLVGGAVLFLAVGLFKLQVVEHDELTRMSETNQLRLLPIVPRRGAVLDRTGRIVVDSRPSYTLSIIPAHEKKGVTVERVASLLGTDTTEIRTRMRRTMINSYQPAPIARDVGFEVIAILEEQGAEFPGVIYETEQVRRYNDTIGSEPFTGYVSEVSPAELKQPRFADIRPGAFVGKKGLERSYDSLLRGIEGVSYIEVSSKGQVLGEHDDRPAIAAEAGATLITSIDLDLQYKSAAILDTFCCGAIVAMDPRTGEILAMTSFPRYNANMFSSTIPADVWRSIMADSSHPLLNRPLAGLYPPGSTVKFVAVGAALDLGYVSPSTLLYPCRGGYQFGTRFFGCWEERGHGSLTAAESLEHSCDTYLYQLGIKIGIDELTRYYKACGFATPTGVDLPGEQTGLSPTTEYLNKRYGERGWTNAVALNVAIGQGEILVTPLQLTQFFCGLAMNGPVYRPHMVKTIVRDNRVKEIKPTVAFTLPFKPSTMQVLREGMRLVVEGPGGTAKRLRNKYYTIGGKTGTAQNPHGENHSWFVGVAPLEAPEIVCCAIVENSGHGSEVAAPVVGQVIEAYMFKKLGLDTIKVAETTEPPVPAAP